MTHLLTSVPRLGTGCCKWDEDNVEDLIPMWVADMEFQTAPPIIDALRSRVEHGVFGYTHVPDAYYEALIGWFARRHHWQMQREWIIYTSGVVPAISAIIKAMTQPGDQVLVQTPVYNCFFSSIRNNGCLCVENTLRYEDNTYHIDYDDMERKCADPRTRLFLLCNPHNPAGRVWTRDELQRMGEICLRHEVFVIADEIHCELTMPGYAYTPYGSISQQLLDNCAVCTSPSKAFNTAGLQIANITAADPTVRQRIDRAINDNEVCDVNPFGIVGLIAAYNECEGWLDHLRQTLWENYQLLLAYFAEHLPQYPVTKLEGTYLVWVNTAASGRPSDQLCHELMQREHVRLNDGLMYGACGRDFVRINIAMPTPMLMQGLSRIHRFLA